MKRTRIEHAEEIRPPSQMKITGMKEQETMEIEAASAPPKTPAKKSSLAACIGRVPESLSAWFSPRRSDRLQNTGPAARGEHDESSGPLRQRTSPAGLTTTHAYFTPLSALAQKLNPPSLARGDHTIDVLAVVTNPTKAPERAQGGPRDYFTVFHVADPTLELEQTISVEVFRPFHATLPVARTGDVVLLRAFHVRSRTRQPYLLSSDASSWVVWRYMEHEASTSGSRISPRRPSRGSVSGAGAREEIKGPPVEYGEGERKRVRELRMWWQGRAGADHQEQSVPA